MLAPVMFTGFLGCWKRRLFLVGISRYSRTILLVITLCSLCAQAIAIDGPSAFTCEPYWDYRIVCHVSGTGDPNTGGNLIVRSLSPISWQPLSGHIYPVDYGSRLADDVFLINNARNIWDAADENLEAGRTYFYRAWIYDNDMTYSATSATCQCVPTGESSVIESCTQIGARPGESRILLEWENPTAGDYSETMVVRSPQYIRDWRPVNGHVYTVGEGVSSTIRVVALGSGLQFFLDRDVTNDTTYYYRIYAGTAAQGYSWGAPIEAMPTSRSVGPHYRLKDSWGQPGTEPGAFHAGYGPAGICLIPSQDAVLVADYGNRRVQSFSREGDLIAEHWEQAWFDNSPEEYQILDVEFLPNGRIASGGAVGDRVLASYTHVNPDRGYGIASYYLTGYIEHGNTNFELYHLPSYSSLAHSIRKEGTHWCDNALMVVNVENQLLEFDEGAFLLRSWGTEGQNPGQLHYPLSVVQGPDGYVHVGDETGRIQKFTVGGTYVSLAQWLPEGEMAWDMAKDRYGNFYVLSSGYKVYKFDADWKCLLGFDIQSPGGWAYPRTGRLCVDSDECVYVTDATACQVKVFAPTDSNGTMVTYNSYAAEPINTRTGRYVYEHTDRRVDEIGLSFGFTRVYNSGDSYFDVFGSGWRHSYDIRVSQARANALVVHWGDGHDVVYEDWGDGYKPVLPGAYEIVTRETDGTYRVTRKEQVVYAFDTQGRLASISDKNAKVTSLTYDSFNRLVTIICPSGRTCQLSYHPSGFLASLQDPLSRQVTYEYDADGNLSQVIDAEGHTTTFTYDVNGWITRVTDALGRPVVQNEYVNPEAGRVVAKAGKVTSQKNATDNETTFQYEGNRTTMTDPLGFVTLYDYDSLGRMITQTDPDGLTTAFEYDADNNRTKVTDRKGNVTRYEYDDQGNMTRKTDAAGQTVIITYNAQNQPLTKTDEGGATTQFEYDEQGNLTTTTDALGLDWTRTYDSTGLLLSETDPLGHSTSYAYDAEGNLAEATNPLGNQTTYAYDAAGRRLSETDALGNTTIYEYDGNDKLIAKTDALGQVTSYEYDANGNRIRIVYPEGSEKTFTYDETDSLLTETDELGHVTTYTYDANGRKTSVTDAAGGVTSYAYDSVGNMVSATDAKGNTTAYENDGNGNRLSTTDPLGNATTMTYDALNRNTSTTDPLGNVTTLIYDAMGRVLSRTAPDGGVGAFTYDALGRKTGEADPLGHTTLLRYDEGGRMTETENALGQITVYAYDANGNRTQVTDPLSHSTTFTYDALKRQITLTDALGNVTETHYDALGRNVGATDALGRTTSYSHDTRNRLVAVTDAMGKTTVYAYDVAGNMVSFTNARGKTWAYAYDTLNRRISETTPEGNTETYAYDAVGNRISYTGPDSQETTYAYDAANRLTDVNHPDGLHVQYTYDAAGRRTIMADGVGTTTYVYDSVGRITGTTDPFGKSVGYSYDVAGNKSTLTYPDSDQATYVYDALNRMVSVTDWNTNTTAYAYDAAGRLTQETAPNGIVTTYQYDAANRLIHKTITKPDKVLLAEYTLTLDAAGNRIDIDMTQPEMPPSPSGEDTHYAYDDDNRILTADDTTYAFDGRGRMTSKTTPEGTTTYTFDYRDRLTKVTAPSRTDQYRYDGNGNRIESAYGSETTRYLLDLTQDMTWVLCETDAEGAITAKYLYGNGLLAAQRSDTASYFHYDQLGNTVAVTETSAATSSTYAYDEFGKTTARSGTLTTPFQYIGQLGVQHEPNDLLFMRARYYDPQVGGFLAVDPVEGVPTEPSSLHDYLYAMNNPVIQSDPSGEVVPFLLLAVAVYGASAYFALDFVGDNPLPENADLIGKAEYLAGGTLISAAKAMSFADPTGISGSLAVLGEGLDNAEGISGNVAFGAARDVVETANLAQGLFGGFYKGIRFQPHATRGWLQASAETATYMSDVSYAGRIMTGATKTLGMEVMKSLGQGLVEESRKQGSFHESERLVDLTVSSSSPQWPSFVGFDYSSVPVPTVGHYLPPQSRGRSVGGGISSRRLASPEELSLGVSPNEPVIYERYEPKYRLINKSQLKDMD